MVFKVISISRVHVAVSDITFHFCFDVSNLQPDDILKTKTKQNKIKIHTDINDVI